MNKITGFQNNYIVVEAVMQKNSTYGKLVIN